MKILVTATAPDADAEVDPRFGRAKHFAIYDTEEKSFSFVDNAQNLNAPSGAGVQAAANVARAGAEVVITGNCGPKAFHTLTAAKIKIAIGATGTVREAIKKFEGDELDIATEANVEGHW